MALLRASETLPLGGRAALCVTLRSSRTESALSVRWVEAPFALPGPLLLDAMNDRHVVCTEQQVLEDAPAPGQYPPSFGRTKTGGFPGFVQEPLRPRCATCGDDLAFCAQLAEDVFDCYFGDAGRVYVFVCPRGCGGDALAQS